MIWLGAVVEWIAKSVCCCGFTVICLLHDTKSVKIPGWLGSICNFIYCSQPLAT